MLKLGWKVLWSVLDHDLEASDRLKRSPPCNDEDLHAFCGVPLQEQSADIPVETSQLGQHAVLQMGRIRGGLCWGGLSRPDSRDHVLPITVVHWRTLQRVTSPLFTYGSDRANDSATSGDEPRNTNTAPSTGSASAPARTNSPRWC